MAQVDVPSQLMGAHAAIALTALARLVETAERHDRLGELPAAILDALNELPAAIRRWQGDEPERQP
jgi:hypothetical protein